MKSTTTCWPYLQHVALHKSGPFLRQTTIDSNNNNDISNNNNLITIRNMSIYSYMQEHFNTAVKRHRRFSGSGDEEELPSPKVRKHHHSNNNSNKKLNSNQKGKREEEQRKYGPNSTMHNYDIRFFFYINSLILFTMSCRQYEGDDLKHFIVYHIREFDRMRRKARKRRKRKIKPEPATVTATAAAAAAASLRL